MKILTMLCLSFLLASGCSGSGSQTDGEPDGDGGDQDPVRDADSDNTGDDAVNTDRGDPGPLPDFDPDAEFLLVIPPDTSLCSTFNAARTWEQELPMLGRIDLVPGRYVFPRREGSFESELIEGFLFGPEATSLDPTALPGEVEAEKRDVDRWVYRLKKRFSDGNQPFEVVVRFWIDSRDGPWPEVVTVDQEFLQSSGLGLVHIGPGEDHMTEQQAFASCVYPQARTNGHIATTAGDDRIEIEMGDCLFNCLACGGFTMCRYFIAARITLDGQGRSVADPFRLVYSAYHHNEDETFLVRLDPPVGAVAAIVVTRPVPGLYSGELIRLDIDLQELSRTDLTGWTP